MFYALARDTNSVVKLWLPLARDKAFKDRYSSKLLPLCFQEINQVLVALVVGNLQPTL
jgi:hypothetical protein